MHASSGRGWDQDRLIPGRHTVPRWVGQPGLDSEERARCLWRHSRSWELSFTYAEEGLPALLGAVGITNQRRKPRG